MDARIDKTKGRVKKRIDCYSAKKSIAENRSVKYVRRRNDGSYHFEAIKVGQQTAIYFSLTTFPVISSGVNESRAVAAAYFSISRSI